ncbi:MAG: hypothetical protein B7Y41_11415 [Hydrogenophilales bacterium 28-61-23]|nr:MAG: hypothetical protein B7Y41_11415 [Hydrogenophilales bacterium 28-61-23]
MKRIKFPLVILAAAMGMVSLSAQATNGYFLPGFGIRSMGMGGVGIAFGEDAISAAANPANLSRVGHRMDIGATLFNPVRTATVWDRPIVGADPSTQAGGWGFHGGGDSSEEIFLMPEFGFAMPLFDGISVGIAMVGNGGMNTTYRDNFFSFGAIPGQKFPIGVDLMQVLIPLTVAFQPTENHSFGFSLIPAVQRFAANGLQAFKAFDASYTITSDPDHLTNKGFDWSMGAGARMGWLGSFFNDRVSLGATYSSKIYMSRFEKYQGLFAEQGDFDIPENWGVGIALKPVKSFVMSYDVMRIRYSRVASVANRGPEGWDNSWMAAGIDGIFSTWDPALELGNDLGMGFGWSDQVVHKFGVQYEVNNKLTVRAGYNYGKSPIANDQVTFNTLAPAVTEQHYSVGFTYKLEKDVELTGFYMYAEQRNQIACGQNIIDCADIGMHQNSLGLNMSYLF